MVSQVYDDDAFGHKVTRHAAGWNLMLNDGSVRFRTSGEAVRLASIQGADYATFLYILQLLEKGL
jgi:hypothetical protein